jgi:hypothetical protein
VRHTRVALALGGGNHRAPFPFWTGFRPSVAGFLPVDIQLCCCVLLVLLFLLRRRVSRGGLPAWTAARRRQESAVRSNRVALCVIDAFRAPDYDLDVPGCAHTPVPGRRMVTAMAAPSRLHSGRPVPGLLLLLLTFPGEYFQIQQRRLSQCVSQPPVSAWVS